MKSVTKKRNVSLTPARKRAAKKNSFSSMLSSFKTEGVNFSPEQIKSIKSRLKLPK